MEERALEQLKKGILAANCFAPGDRIAVAFSGGADSLCLLYGLFALREDWGLDLAAVHVNHGLRGAEADGDAEAALALCRRLQIPCTVLSADVAAVAEQEACSLETAARLVRYRLLDEFCQRERRKLAVAHNKSDLAETVLMRILRGTGPDGLASMEAVGRVPGGLSVLCRPLLALSGETLRRFCSELGLTPRQDSTNEQPIYLRNKVRLELLPLLQKDYNPNVEEALARLSAIAAEDRQYWDQTTEEALQKALLPAEDLPAEGALRLCRKTLNDLHPSVRKRVLVEALRRVGMAQDLTEAHLTAACRMLAGDAPSGELELPGNFCLRLVYDAAVCFQQDGEPSPQSLGTLTVTFYPREEWDALSLLQNAEGVQKAWFDLDLLQQAFGTEDLASQIVLRTRKPGDRLPLKEGSQKLQDFLVNAKVPKTSRDSLPLAAVNDRILWIPGLRRCDGFPVTEETRRILYLEYK